MPLNLVLALGAVALGAIAQGRFVVLLMTWTELLTRHATDANVTRLYYDKGTEKSLALLPHELPDSLNQGLASVAREADQDDTGRFGMADEDQPAKVFILCQQDTFLATGLINQFAVVGAARCFAHGEDIIALCPQSAHGGKVTACGATVPLSSARKRRARASIRPFVAGWFRGLASGRHKPARPGCPPGSGADMHPAGRPP